MMDLNVLILVIVGVFLVLFFIVFPIIFDHKQAGVVGYFRKNRSIRFELVQNLSKDASTFPNDLSNLEMVALLTMIAFRETVSESFISAQRFTAMGWMGKFNHEFFDELNSTARVFTSNQWYQASIDLSRLGLRLAEANNDLHWAKEFTESIQRLKHQQAASELPLKKR